MIFAIWAGIGFGMGITLYKFDKTPRRGGIIGSIFLGILGAIEGGYFLAQIGSSQTPSDALKIVGFPVLGSVLFLIMHSFFAQQQKLPLFK